MTERVASCPGCGATMRFASAATVYAVCGHCGGASERTDLDLAYLGKVSEVAALASPLDLGAGGRWGRRTWTCVGQVQLDHGLGPWNEWCLLFDDGAWGWYAEAQGEAHLTFAAPAEVVASAPAWSATHPGSPVALPGRTGFVVAEIGTGRVVAVRGELPRRVVPGTSRRYADLRGPDGGFATLDYGAGEACEDVYVGATVDPADLGLAPPAAGAAERRVAARRLACPSCAGEVELRDPASVRVVCASCGTLLEPGERAVLALGKAAELSAQPRIPLGAVATLRGARVTVLAYLVRSVTADGVRYPWREYLLRTDRGAHRWLVESHGHWALLDPVNPADVGRAGEARTWRGVRFRHFTTGDARVDHVQGELYWQVEVGETVRSEDFVAPPRLLTLERTGKELHATAGEWLPAAEVATAFGVRLEEPRGVAPGQPNPLAGQVARWWLVGGLLLALAVVVMLVVGSTQGAERVGWLWPGLFLLGGLLLPPVVVTTRRANFEVRRWRDSDHPVGEA